MGAGVTRCRLAAMTESRGCDVKHADQLLALCHVLQRCWEAGLKSAHHKKKKMRNSVRWCVHQTLWQSVHSADVCKY